MRIDWEGLSRYELLTRYQHGHSALTRNKALLELQLRDLHPRPGLTQVKENEDEDLTYKKMGTLLASRMPFCAHDTTAIWSRKSYLVYSHGDLISKWGLHRIQYWDGLSNQSNLQTRRVRDLIREVYPDSIPVCENCQRELPSWGAQVWKASGSGWERRCPYCWEE